MNTNASKSRFHLLAGPSCGLTLPERIAAQQELAAIKKELKLSQQERLAKSRKPQGFAAKIARMMHPRF
jgi:hypothetical protein